MSPERCTSVSFIGVVNDIAALAILHAPRYLSAFTKAQLQALALLFLNLHSYTTVSQQFLWGLWLLPFGLLVMRSGFLPRILGILLVINCWAYIITSLTIILAPEFGRTVANLMFIPETGELWIALWLLIKGVKPAVA